MSNVHDAYVSFVLAHPEAYQWWCQCGELEEYDGLVCARCGMRPRWAAEAHRARRAALAERRRRS
jgi:hypothetical protein